jgi:hypothetical protein
MVNLRSWQDEDEALFNVVEGIRKAIEELKAQSEKIQSKISTTEIIIPHTSSVAYA